MGNTKQLIVRISPELHTRLIEIAKERDVSLAAFVREALVEASETKNIPLRATESGYHLAIPPEHWFHNYLQYYCGYEVDGKVLICSDCQEIENSGCGKAISNDY